MKLSAAIEDIGFCCSVDLVNVFEILCTLITVPTAHVNAKTSVQRLYLCTSQVLVLMLCFIRH